MNKKKVITIMICITIFTTSVTGVYISYAKSDGLDQEINEQDMSNYTYLAPTPEVSIIDSDVPDKESIELALKDAKVNEVSKSEVIYEGTRTSVSSDKNDLYNINSDELDELLKEGYTVQDILKADEIANNIYMNPKVILEKKNETGKSFEEVEKDLINEQKLKTVQYIKSTYTDEYAKLTSLGYSEEDVVNIICYLNMNGMELTDSFLNEYKAKGNEIFKNSYDTQVSVEDIEKYDINNEETKELSNNLIKALEKLSEKTGKPVNELINSLNNNK